MGQTLLMLNYKFFFNLESLSSYSSTPLFLSLESSFENGSLHFLLSCLFHSFTLKQLQPKVTNSLLKYHLFRKTFPNPSIYNTKPPQFKIASCFSPGHSHPPLLIDLFLQHLPILTYDAIHFSSLSFASLDENVSSMRAGIFVCLVSASILDVNEYLYESISICCSGLRYLMLFCILISLFFSCSLASVMLSPRFSSSL